MKAKLFISFIVCNSNTTCLSTKNKIMKKINLILFICLLYTVQFFYAQKITSARVTYTVDMPFSPDYLKKVNNDFSLSDDVRKTLTNMHYLNKPVTSVLIFKNEESFYLVSEKDIQKSIDNKGTRGVNMSFVFAGSKNPYYINLSKKEQFYKAKNLAMQYELVYFEEPTWTLVKGTTKILGYTCKKAIKIKQGRKGKRETILWYTKEIPVKFGPKGFYNLPGLVLKVEEGNNSFVATKVEINPKNIRIEKPTAKLKTTLEEKMKGFRKMMDEEN